jgi:hypothetical protein
VDKSLLAAAWYNYACAAAVAGHVDASIDDLRKAVDLGSEDVANMANDSDLKSLRGDQRFAALIQQAKSAATSPKTN